MKILVYGHVDILWTYQGAKIEIQIFDDFNLIVLLQCQMDCVKTYLLLEKYSVMWKEFVLWRDLVYFYCSFCF